jgi:hypothetical protein
VTPCCPTYWRSASSVLFNAITPWSVAGSGVGVGAGVGVVIVATGERRGRKRFTRPNEPDRDYGGRRPDSSSDRSRCSRHCPISTAACFSCDPRFGEQGQQAGVDLVDWHSALALLTSRPVEPPGGGPVRPLTSRASSTPLEGQVGSCGRPVQIWVQNWVQLTPNIPHNGTLSRIESIANKG